MSGNETAELPTGWTWARLEELADPAPNSITDGPFGSNLKTSDYVDSGVRVIRLGNIGATEFIDKDRSYVSEAKFETLRKHEVFPGDLVIAALAEPVGRCVEVPSTIGRALVKADCVRFKPRSDVCRRFIFYALNSPGGRKRAEASSHGIGRLRMNLGDMRALRVPIAPLNEQRRIVAKLDTVTSASRRAKNALDAIPNLLEQFRQSILAAAFRGELTKDWRAKNPDVEPAGELLKRIRIERRRKSEQAESAKRHAKGKPAAAASQYREPDVPEAAGAPALPGSWVWSTIETVGDVHLGRQRAPQHLVGEHFRPYLRVANIKDDRIDFCDVEEMNFTPEEFAHYSLRAGDVLLSEGQSPELVGQSAIYRGEIDGLCFQKTLHRFRSVESGPSPEFAQLVFRHYVRSGFFKAAASVTTNIAHLTLVRLKALRFPLPPRAEQVEIVRRASAALRAIERVSESVRALGATRKTLDSSLLEKAFRGELVAGDGPDEAISDLLARPPNGRARATKPRGKSEPMPTPTCENRLARRD